MRNGKRVPIPCAEWPERMTPEQLADCLGFGIDTIRYAINFQGLKFKRIGQRRQLIKREDAIEWLDETDVRERNFEPA